MGIRTARAHLPDDLDASLLNLGAADTGIDRDRVDIEFDRRRAGLL